MKEIYPDYAEQVKFYAVGTLFGASESLESLESYREAKGHPWPIATTPSDDMAVLGVTTQSTKIAFNSQGIITYRDGMGAGDDEEWSGVFMDLAAQ